MDQTTPIRSYKSVELLAPAKNAEIGKIAINHGADAVYIGAPMFSARAAAGNSVADIASLATYAHRFGAKVLVALNTILTDAELAEAEKLIGQLYDVGVDALIVQDMGILSLHLPPIRLHASTQCNNRTVAQVQRLQAAGFSRVVLARELSLEQIAAIRAATQIELEAFVHGALCVSYSGQCYLSQALRGRSANRGACAQMCRLPYDLLDADGQILAQGKHLLSLKDMDRSAALPELLDAGVTSLKIEGRLKDADYVKNVVAFYRQKLDGLLENSDKYKQASWGKTEFFFQPDPQKTFHRSQTEYFLHGRTPQLTQPNTPKSTGEPVGRVLRVERGSLLVDTDLKMANGDGFCFVSEGFMANRIEGNRVFPAKMPEVKVGTMLYRNFDHDFERLLQQKTANRTLPLHLLLAETADGFSLSCTEPNSGRTASVQVKTDKMPAQKPEMAAENIRTQLGKLGGTDYFAEKTELQLSQAWFLPTSLLNEWRRRVVELLDEQPMPAKHNTAAHESNLVVEQSIDYTGNVYNAAARQFYLNHGAEHVEPAYEAQPVPEAALMTCKFCLKYEMGWCPKLHPVAPPREPLSLRLGDTELHLHFDCKNCEMILTK